MSRMVLATLTLVALAACGRGDRSDVASADSLNRDLQLAPVDTSAVLNDQPSADTATPAPPATPAPAPASKPKPTTRENNKPEPKPETPPETTNATGAATTNPPPPVAPLRTPTTPVGPEATRQIREMLARAQSILNNVDYQKLTPDRRATYDSAKSYITQSEDAMKKDDLMVARSFAERAEIIAKQLEGR